MRLLLSFLMLSFLSPLSCGDSGSQKASLTAGLIRRDSETTGAIRRTASTKVQPGSGSRLKLVITKSRYRLDVYEADSLLKTYPVALGGSPQGHKQVMGDQRTPEGDYLLIPHHPSPSFGSCFYICYPGISDAERGLAQGQIGKPEYDRISKRISEKALPPHGTKLGGLILLHGTKRRSSLPLTITNWTLGCIAMENKDLLELLGAYGRLDRPVLSIRP